MRTDAAPSLAFADGASETGEIIVDGFAGGGGASEGIEEALGRPVDVALNHDRYALAIHAVNHPDTHHAEQDIWDARPLDVTRGRPVGLAWFSPDCTHHSKAKGGQPRKREIRTLAWSVVHWAQRVKPRVIVVENVEEFRHWGPLDEAGKPIKQRAGEEFDQWIRALRHCGYRVEWREIRASDFGAPTIRKRLFIIARRDRKPIEWPAPTHGPAGSGLLPYRTAAEIIDWSLMCPSIFLTREEGRALGVNRPLVDATMARIARGVQRYVIDAAEPFLIPVTHRGDLRVHGVDEPLRTVTTAHRGEQALVAPYLVPRYGERPGQDPRCRDIQEPMPTVVGTGNGANLVAAFLAQHNTGVVGHPANKPLSTIIQTGTTQAVVAAHLKRDFGHSTGHALDRPLATVTAGGGGKTALVASHLLKLRGTCRDGQDARAPLPTATAGGTHIAEVRSFLLKYFGTATGQDCREPLHSATSRARFGLVMVAGEPWQIVDIGMRMLTPRELFRAQGFPDSYVIDPIVDGKPLTKTRQIAAAGNSVCPPVAAAIVKANCADLAVGEAREAAE